MNHSNFQDTKIPILVEARSSNVKIDSIRPDGYIKIFITGECILVSVSFWPLLIIESVARVSQHKWERNFEVTFGIFSVLVFQINVLESYLDIYLF